MSNQGPNSPGTAGTSNVVGSNDWTNPNNCKINDDNETESTGFNYQYSYYLKATNFGFTIPSGVIIDGILVEIRRADLSGNGILDYRLRIVKSDGSIGTTDKADNVNLWPETYTYKSYGGSTDKWGETWAYSDINDADFGVVFSINYYGGFKGFTSGQVDHIQITVYYTAGASSAIKAVSGVAQAGMGKVSGTAASGIGKIGGVANS